MLVHSRYRRMSLGLFLWDVQQVAAALRLDQAFRIHIRSLFGNHVSCTLVLTILNFCLTAKHSHASRETRLAFALPRCYSLGADLFLHLVFGSKIISCLTSCVCVCSPSKIVLLSLILVLCKDLKRLAVFLLLLCHLRRFLALRPLSEAHPQIFDASLFFGSHLFKKLPQKLD